MLIAFAASGVNFLSHLCGEEANNLVKATGGEFLSHLCGEEGRTQTELQEITFLSHLCGEEVLSGATGVLKIISKSPMR